MQPITHHVVGDRVVVRLGDDLYVGTITVVRAFEDWVLIDGRTSHVPIRHEQIVGHA